MLPHGVVASLGLDDPAGLRLVGGRVSKVWRCRRRGMTVAVRESPWFRTLDEVDWECRVLDHLHRREAPVVVPAAGPFLVDGTVWAAFRWAEGTPPVTPVDPRAYGRLLAELHNRSRTLVRLGQRPGWGQLAEFYTQPRAGGELSLASTINEWANATGPVAVRLRTLAAEVHERLSAVDWGALPLAVVHGDFGTHQVLERPFGAVTVLDWDFSHVDAALADVAIAASVLCRPSVDRAELMLRGYLETAEQDPGDLRLLPDFRRAFHLSNLANQVCALWTHGLPMALDALTERLAREEWWGPLLVEAGDRAQRKSSPSLRSAVSQASSDLEIAHELADRAALAAMHFFTTGVVAEFKADESPVTAADHAVERLLRESLAVVRPDDAVLGEEFGLTGEGARTWILDPIDGTQAFAAGDRHWRVQIALRDGASIVLAVVDEPVTGRRWWATANSGTFERRNSTLEERRLRVSTRRAVHEAVIAHYPSTVLERLPPHRPMEPRSPLPLVELIQGEIDAFFVDCCQVWDHAPWILLVQEAGGRFTDHEGGTAPDKRGGLYSNAHVHDALLAAVLPRIAPR
jgi:fructose-1,6-bisphosphatase/inositol monophosphatase family enzyme/Ser/Thr protein kinase RdoA (MazF antagonist)